MLNGDGPTKDHLKTIRQWPDNFTELMEYIEDLWLWPERFSCKDNLWTVSTGGWSGHEEIIEAMEENVLFWTLCWMSSKRGGHYVFEVKK